MMAEQAHTVSVLSSALGDLVSGLEGTLEKAKTTLKDVGASEFAESKVGMLWSAVGLYVTAYRKLTCMTRSQIEELIEKHFRYMEIQDVFDHLEEVECDWDEVLKEVDAEMNKSESTERLIVGGMGPSVTLTDARTGEDTSLEKHLDGRSIICVLLRHFA